MKMISVLSLSMLASAATVSKLQFKTDTQGVDCKFMQDSATGDVTTTCNFNAPNLESRMSALEGRVSTLEGTWGQKGATGAAGANGNHGTNGVNGSNGAKGAKGETATMAPVAAVALPTVSSTWHTDGRRCGNGCCGQTQSMGTTIAGFAPGLPSAINYADTLQGVTLSSELPSDATGFFKISWNANTGNGATDLSIHESHFSVMTSTGSSTLNRATTYSSCGAAAFPVTFGPSIDDPTCIAMSNLPALSRFAVSLGHGHMPAVGSIELVESCP